MQALPLNLATMPVPYDVTHEELALLLGGAALPGAPGLGWPPRPGAPTRRDDGAAGSAACRRWPRRCRRRCAKQAKQSADAGQTTKWLWTLHDGAQVETVLMRYPDRVTVCVSTQAGCAMACQFCATGQAGFQRHLSQGEIVEQVAVAMREAGRGGSPTWCSWGWASRWPTTTGSGCRRPSARRDGTLGVAPHLVHGRDRARYPAAGRRSLPVNLAVSLHAANDVLRDELVPINRRYPLADLAAACAEYVAASGRRLSIEWALIDGVNDREATPTSWRPSPARWAPTSTSSRSTPRPATRWWARRRRGCGSSATSSQPPGQRHHPDHPGRGDRRRLWAAGGRRIVGPSGCDAGPIAGPLPAR